MGAGIQCFDSNGNLTFDATWAPGRFIGQVSTGGNAGSITVAAFANGNPFWVISGSSVFATSQTQSGTHYPLIVTLSGNTLSWKYNTPSGNASAGDSATIIYGYYP